MRWEIYNKDGVKVEEVTLSKWIQFLDSWNFCVVCEDVADYVGYFLYIPWKYLGIISEYRWLPTERQILLRPIIYHLASVLFDDKDYDNVDVADILNDLLDKYISVVGNNFIDKWTIQTTWIKVSVSIKWRNCLEVLSWLNNYLRDWYRIVFDIGSKPIKISLIKDDFVSLDKTQIAEIWYNWIASVIINRVIVSNWKDIKVIKEDTASKNKFWVSEKVVVNYSIKNEEAANNLADSILQQYARPKKKISYIKVKNDDLLVFNKWIIIDWQKYYITWWQILDNYNILYLSDKPFLWSFVGVDVLFELYQKTLEDNKEIQQQLEQKADEFTTTVRFNAKDWQTIEWTNWELYLKDWTSIHIASWSYVLATDDIYYIYVEKDTGNVVFTTNASEAVGENKIFIGGAKKAGDTNKLAEFTIFWTDNKNILVWRWNILANSIWANEIAANSIKAEHIQSWAITTNKIAIWAVDSDRVNFNYAGSNSKWWNAIDVDYVDWTPASTVRKWAYAASQALDSATYRYKKWLQAADMESGSNPYTWVIFDRNWIRWYKSGTKTFEIDAQTWDAFFRWTIWASSFTTNWYLVADNWSGEKIWFGIESNLPKIKFYDDNTYVWHIAWDKIIWNWHSYKVIKVIWGKFWVDNDIICGWDVILSWNILLWDKLYIVDQNNSSAYWILENRNWDLYWNWTKIS